MTPVGTVLRRAVVVRSVSGSHRVPTDNPASFRPSQNAKSKPKASMPTKPRSFVHSLAGAGGPVAVAVQCWPRGTICTREWVS